jgi:archaellum component FlaG (FlaF/FlaG flagellin family)
MRKGAIIVFAFLILFWGCQSRTIYPPAPVSTPSFPPPSTIEKPVVLSDLAISDVTLDDLGRVVITLSNVGKGHVPPQSGVLKIYVEGDLKWNISLGSIPDQAFLEPGGVTVYTAPVELEGTHRVMAVVDSDRALPEIDESNNILTKVLSYRRAVPLPPGLPPPPPKPEESSELLSYPDLTISHLDLSPDRKLVIHIVNIGNEPFPLREATVRIFVDGILKGSYPLASPMEKSHLFPKEEILMTTSVAIIGRHEVYAYIVPDPESKERNLDNNGLRKRLESLPIGPDLLVKEFDLSEDFDLTTVLSNAGELELPKGTTLRIRIYMNGQKVSEFVHFISEPLKPYLESRYVIDPPYRVRVSANSRVKVVISPRQPKDDVRPENNSLERNFAIFPFKIEPQTSQEFSLDLSNPDLKESRRGEIMKAEVRWDGGGAPVKLSLKGGANLRRISPIKGKSPLKLEVPIEEGPNRKGKAWRFSITNLMEKKAEGHLIIQSP